MSRITSPQSNSLREIQETSVDIVRRAVEAVSKGDVEAGADVLRTLDGAALETVFNMRMAESRHAKLVRGKFVGRLVGPSKKEVFDRDGYCCRYCGTRTIDEDIWPALDRADPCHEILRWDKNWPKDVTHWVVWVLTSSDEHQEPKAAGGTHSLDNRVCACYACQQAKLSRRLLDLQTRPGWALLKRDTARAWDGLASYVPAVISVSREYNLTHRTQPARVRSDKPGIQIALRNVTVGSLISLGGKSRFIVQEITGDRTPSVGLRDAVGQRNGRWKVSKTVQSKVISEPIYLVAKRGPESGEPCD